MSDQLTPDSPQTAAIEPLAPTADKRDNPSKALYEQNFAVLMPPNPNKDQYSRLLFYLEWLDHEKLPWYQPELQRYQRYLLKERTRPHQRTGDPIPATISTISAKSHLGTIRSRYETILKSNTLRTQLYEALPADVKTPSDQKALVDELILRLQNEIDPANSTIPELDVRDRADSEHLWLTPAQVRALVRAPGLATLPGLRDTAMFALMVCTGIREAELVALNVDDLRQTLGGELALRIRQGKGFHQRLVPYGALDWCLVYVSRWLEEAKITSGAVFRGIYRGGKRVRATRISTRAVNQIIAQYQITIKGALTTVQPHDLRRTYARNAYLQGMDAERLRQNLGHISLQTTQGYIGTLDAAHRRPPEMFRMPHNPKELGASDEG